MFAAVETLVTEFSANSLETVEVEGDSGWSKKQKIICFLGFCLLITIVVVGVIYLQMPPPTPPVQDLPSVQDNPIISSTSDVLNVQNISDAAPPVQDFPIIKESLTNLPSYLHGIVEPLANTNSNTVNTDLYLHVGISLKDLPIMPEGGYVASINYPDLGARVWKIENVLVIDTPINLDPEIYSFIGGDAKIKFTSVPNIKLDAHLFELD